jgi:hypothetical protein
MGPLHAGALGPATNPSRLPAAFPKGTWDLEATGSFAWEFYPYDHEKLATGSVGVGYYLANNFSVSVGVPVSHVRQPETRDATMVGLDLRLRYHFLQYERFTFFGDLTGGLSQSSREVPPFGTYFNFTAQVGIGATWRLADHVDIVGGLHLFHLSNAAIEGVYRNPDLNAVQPYLGVMFTF